MAGVPAQSAAGTTAEMAPAVGAKGPTTIAATVAGAAAKEDQLLPLVPPPRTRRVAAVVSAIQGARQALATLRTCSGPPSCPPYHG